MLIFTVGNVSRDYYFRIKVDYKYRNMKSVTFRKR